MFGPKRHVLSRDAFKTDFILTSVEPNYAYQDNQRTNEVNGQKCIVAMPGYGYDKLTIKLPLDVEVDPDLIGKAVDFPDFAAKAYYMNGREGYSVSASSVIAAKGMKT